MSIQCCNMPLVSTHAILPKRPSPAEKTTISTGSYFAMSSFSTNSTLVNRFHLIHSRYKAVNQCQGNVIENENCVENLLKFTLFPQLRIVISLRYSPVCIIYLFIINTNK